MKILWITNIVFPEAESQISGKSEIISSGGWLLGMSEGISRYTEIELITATVSKEVKELVEIHGERITHFVFPKAKKHFKYVKEYEKFWIKIINKCQPDIVHIHGTECPHSLPCMRLYPNLKYVVSIQGLISEIAKHYYDGISINEIIKNITLRDLYKGNIIQERNRFIERGKCEIEILKNTKHVIGRTTWDHAISETINPDIIYHKGNESLREPFYSGQWRYEECNPHTIFLSQVHQSFKGFHVFVKALPLLVQRFPDLKVRIAGTDIIRSEGSWQVKMRLNGYGKILREMISSLKLEKYIIFLGLLNAEEMKSELLKANVFVSCSSIDNSPNSLGEAQMLGVPCVASYVGGVPSMIQNENCGLLYRFEDYQTLSYHIKRIFTDNDCFDNTEMREVAHRRHNKENNAKDLIQIYKDML